MSAPPKQIRIISSIQHASPDPVNPIAVWRAADLYVAPVTGQTKPARCKIVLPSTEGTQTEWSVAGTPGWCPQSLFDGVPLRLLGGARAVPIVIYSQCSPGTFRRLVHTGPPSTGVVQPTGNGRLTGSPPVWPSGVRCKPSAHRPRPSVNTDRGGRPTAAGVPWKSLAERADRDWTPSEES